MPFLIVLLIIVLAVALVLGIRRYVAAPAPISYYPSPVIYDYDDEVLVENPAVLAAEIALVGAMVAVEIAEEIAYEEQISDSYFGDDD